MDTEEDSLLFLRDLAAAAVTALPPPAAGSSCSRNGHLNSVPALADVVEDAVADAEMTDLMQFLAGLAGALVRKYRQRSWEHAKHARDAQKLKRKCPARCCEISGAATR